MSESPNPVWTMVFIISLVSEKSVAQLNGYLYGIQKHIWICVWDL